MVFSDWQIKTTNRYYTSEATEWQCAQRCAVFVSDRIWIDALLMSSPQADLLVAKDGLAVCGWNDWCRWWHHYVMAMFLPCTCVYAAAKVPCAVDVLALEWLFCMVTPPWYTAPESICRLWVSMLPRIEQLLFKWRLSAWTSPSILP